MAHVIHTGFHCHHTQDSIVTFFIVETSDQSQTPEPQDSIVILAWIAGSSKTRSLRNFVSLAVYARIPGPFHTILPFSLCTVPSILSVIIVSSLGNFARA